MKKQLSILTLLACLSTHQAQGFDFPKPEKLRSGSIAATVTAATAFGLDLLAKNRPQNSFFHDLRDELPVIHYLGLGLISLLLYDCIESQVFYRTHPENLRHAREVLSEIDFEYINLFLEIDKPQELRTFLISNLPGSELPLVTAFFHFKNVRGKLADVKSLLLLTSEDLVDECNRELKKIRRYLSVVEKVLSLIKAEPHWMAERQAYDYTQGLGLQRISKRIVRG